MPSVLAYHRPGSLNEAATLLSDPNTRAIGGGTVVVPDARIARETGVELVDLQDLGLAAVTVSGDVTSIGAMARLGDVSRDDRLPALLREVARRELPSALRNQATFGGTVALADPDSVLLAGLLAHGATVNLHDADPVALADLLAAGVGDRIVTSATVETAGIGSVAVTGRTPADVPIVAAVARRSNTGIALALTGVADVPVLVDPANPTQGLNPAGDFRGSAEYRLHVAAVLAARAVSEVSS